MQDAADGVNVVQAAAADRFAFASRPGHAAPFRQGAAAPEHIHRLLLNRPQDDAIALPSIFASFCVQCLPRRAVAPPRGGKTCWPVAISRPSWTTRRSPGIWGMPRLESSSN